MNVECRKFLQAWVAAVADGRVDGLFLPADAAGLSIPDGITLTRYASRGGTLVFRAGAWALYGVASEVAFAGAVRRVAVPAQTVEGVLSLGMARNVAGGGAMVQLVFADVTWSLRWPCDTGDQASTVAERIRRICPEARPVVAADSLSAIWATGVLADGFGVEGIVATVARLPVAVRNEWGFLAIYFLAVVAFCWGAVGVGLGWLSAVGAALGCGLLGVFARRCSQISRAGPAG